MCVSNVCLFCVTVHSWERGTNNSLFALGLSGARGCRRGRWGEKQVWGELRQLGRGRRCRASPEVALRPSLPVGWTWRLMCVGAASQLQWPPYSLVSTFLLGEKVSLWQDERERGMRRDSAKEKVEKEKRDKDSRGCWRKGEPRGLPTCLLQLPRSRWPWGPD